MAAPHTRRSRPPGGDGGLMRTEVVAIGEALVDLGASAGTVDVERLGKLLMRLAVVYGRYVNAKERQK